MFHATTCNPFLTALPWTPDAIVPFTQPGVFPVLTHSAHPDIILGWSPPPQTSRGLKGRKAKVHSPEHSIKPLEALQWCTVRLHGNSYCFVMYDEQGHQCHYHHYPQRLLTAHTRASVAVPPILFFNQALLIKASINNLMHYGAVTLSGAEVSYGKAVLKGGLIQPRRLPRHRAQQTSSHFWTISQNRATPKQQQQQQQ